MRRLVVALSLMVVAPCFADDPSPQAKSDAKDTSYEKARADLERAQAAMALRDASKKAEVDVARAVATAAQKEEAASKDPNDPSKRIEADAAAAKALQAQAILKALKDGADSYDTEKAAQEKAAADKARTEANRDFLGVKFNFGFGAVFFGGRVEEAQVVGEGEDSKVVVTKDSSKKPAIVLESHRLLDIKAPWREPRKDGRGLDLERVVFGVGPFLALQTSQNEVIDTIGLGVMGGFRVGDSSSFNIGVGGLLDPSATYLPPGYVDGAPPPKGYVPGDTLPNGATSIPLIKKGKVGWIVLASFTF